MLEKRAQNVIRKQQAAAEATTNRHAQEHAREEQTTHEAAIPAHLRQQAMEAAIGLGATPEEAIAAGQASAAAVQA